MVLRVGTEDDAAVAADLHAGQIGEGFLAILGPRFLRRLYRRVARTPDSFLLVVEATGTGGSLPAPAMWPPSIAPSCCAMVPSPPSVAAGG